MSKMSASMISDILLEPSTLKQHSELATDADMSIVGVMLSILEDVMNVSLFYYEYSSLVEILSTYDMVG